MPFIGAAVAAAVGLTGTAATVVGGLVSAVATVGVSLGLSSLTKSLQPKLTAGEPLSGLETSVQIGGDVSRQIVVGTCGVRGHLVYHNTYGSNNDFYEQVFVLSDWISDGLSSVIINGDRRSVNPGPINGAHTPYAVDGYQEILDVDFFDGTQTNAFGPLIDNANPSGRWSNNSILSGMTYVQLRWTYRKDHDAYANGIPQVIFETRGARLYDWRKDSTNGGSGSHRWEDLGTWQYSDNPVVAAYNYQRGFYRSGERILGMGAPAYDIVHESYTAAANACDESVFTTGPNETRYRCATILTADADVPHATTLDALLSTFAGYLYDYAGFYVCQAGVAQTAVKTVTDADLVIGQPVTFAAKRSRADLINRIHGQFLDPSLNYEPQSYVPQISAGGQVNDGEELGRQLDLMAVPSRTQAERIARIRLREVRAQATASITLGFNHIDLQAGDWLTWNSARFGLRTWRIVERNVDAITKAVSLQLAEINADVYSWTAADEGVQPASPVRIEPGGRVTTIAGFAVVAGVITNDPEDRQIASLQFFWVPPTDPTIDAVLVEYRRVGTTAASKIIDYSPEDGTIIVTEGIIPGAQYEARATIITTPSRVTTWTDWIPVSISNGIADFLVTFAQLSANLKKTINSLSQIGEGTILKQIRDVRDLLDQGMADAALEAIAAYEATQTSLAAIADERIVRATDDSALAQDITVLTTQVGENEATLTEVSESVDGVRVRYGVIGSINGVTGGFLFSGIQQLDGSVSYNVEINGGLLVTGTISGAKLQATSIITNELQLNSLIVGTTRINFNAVGQFYQTSGSQSVGVNVGWNTICSVGIVGVTGGYAFFIVDGIVPASEATSGDLRILRSDGTVIRQISISSLSTERSSSIMIIGFNGDASSSYTYSVQAQFGGPPAANIPITIYEFSVEVNKR